MIREGVFGGCGDMKTKEVTGDFSTKPRNMDETGTKARFAGSAY